jgi:hypothetical protein
MMIYDFAHSLRFCTPVNLADYNCGAAATTSLIAGPQRNKSWKSLGKFGFLS